MPMTEDEMLAINGVGHRKLECFGGVFMDFIIDYYRLPSVGNVPSLPLKNRGRGGAIFHLQLCRLAAFRGGGQRACSRVRTTAAWA